MLEPVPACNLFVANEHAAAAAAAAAQFVGHSRRVCVFRVFLFEEKLIINMISGAATCNSQASERTIRRNSHPKASPPHKLTCGDHHHQ